MNKLVLRLFVIASCVIAISYASPSELEPEQEQGSNDLEESFGSLTHHSGFPSADVGNLVTIGGSNGEEELIREKRRGVRGGGGRGGRGRGRSRGGSRSRSRGFRSGSRVRSFGRSRGYRGYGRSFGRSRGYGSYGGFGRNRGYRNFGYNSNRRPRYFNPGFGGYNPCYGRYGWFRGQWCGNGNFG